MMTRRGNQHWHGQQEQDGYDRVGDHRNGSRRFPVVSVALQISPIPAEQVPVQLSTGKMEHNRGRTEGPPQARFCVLARARSGNYFQLLLVPGLPERRLTRSNARKD